MTKFITEMDMNKLKQCFSELQKSGKTKVTNLPNGLGKIVQPNQKQKDIIDKYFLNEEI